MAAKLTKRRLQAIVSALSFYLAGEPNDGDELARGDYEAARDWADHQLQRRASKQPVTNESKP